MTSSTRTDLIKQLAEEMNSDLNIDTSNYIDSTQSLDCSALGLSMDSLEKTKNVIEMHERKLVNDRNAEDHQYLLHLKVAKKCVEEIMNQKMAHNLK